MKRLHLELRASIGELERTSAAVAAFGKANNIGEKLLYSLQLVCDEWLTNIVMHGYGAAPSGVPPPADAAAIELTLERTAEDALRLTFVDRAPPFNPLTRPEPDVSLSVDEREVGGLGIHFLRKFMDHCEYERTDGRNRLVLVKYIRGPQGDGEDEHRD